MWSDRIQTAIDVATRLHQNQYRKGEKLPYIVHPVGVAAILSLCGADEDTVVAGYLHDIIEDISRKDYSIEQMVADFGERVTSIVREVSESKDPNIAWKQRKQMYLDHLDQASSREAQLVSAADMTNNMFSFHRDYLTHGGDLTTVFNSSPEDRLWFYQTRYDILTAKLGAHPIIKILTDHWRIAQNDMTRDLGQS